MPRLPPILAFAAPSGTGKTTLIEGVARVLVGRGLRLGVLKADAHRVVLDTPGKDSWRFAEAGAAKVAVLSAERLALFERSEGEQTLVHVIDRLMPDVDLVLAEGFRRSGLPTIQVHRAGGPSTEGWTPPRHRVAWASDVPLKTELPVLPLAQPEVVADWISARFLRPAPPRQPTVVTAAHTPRLQREALDVALRLGATLDAPAMVVLGGGLRADPTPGLRVVSDLRPSLGLLGALLTALAAADTPEILFLGPRHWAAPPALLRGLLELGPEADLVSPVANGHPEPALALYGHRCLSSVQAALLSGELRTTGWWGQVRARLVPPEQWRAWDPEGLAFPR